MSDNEILNDIKSLKKKVIKKRDNECDDDSKRYYRKISKQLDRLEKDCNDEKNS